MPVSSNASQESNSLFRLIAWLDKYRGQPLGEAIELILDHYIESGPSTYVQTSFNALAARHRKYGRVSLRLRVRRGINQKLLDRALSRIIEKDPQRAIHLTQTKGLKSLLKESPLESVNAIQKAVAPRLLGVVQNPLFDLWLTLLDEEKASRLRRCKFQACRRFFVSWPGKKAFCSPNCRDRHWTRPERRKAGHKHQRKSRTPIRRQLDLRVGDN